MRRLTTIPLSRPIYTLRAPLVKTSPKLTRTIPRAEWNPIETSYFVGKSVTLFVMFYTSLQWMFYRKQREDRDK
jgi:hypothetical protein